jgi:hypothetical protein
MNRAVVRMVEGASSVGHRVDGPSPSESRRYALAHSRPPLPDPRGGWVMTAFAGALSATCPPRARIASKAAATGGPLNA